MFKICKNSDCGFSTDHPREKYCGHCGEELLENCPHCGADFHHAGISYCPQCGKMLVESVYESRGLLEF
jgi:predicted amidophosphoribosyltransferase